MTVPDVEGGEWRGENRGHRSQCCRRWEAFLIQYGRC